MTQETQTPTKGSKKKEPFGGHGVCPDCEGEGKVLMQDGVSYAFSEVPTALWNQHKSDLSWCPCCTGSGCNPPASRGEH